MIELTEDNYIGVLMKTYDNIQCNTLEEFESDMYRIVCIKKIIDKYISSGYVNLRLILNHVIVIHNSFGGIIVDLLRLKLEEKHYSVVKPILVYLRYMESDTWNDVYDDSVIFNKLRMI